MAITRREALQDPATRAVVDFYVTLTNLNLGTEVYQTLYEQYPSLKEKIESGRTYPFDTMETHEQKIKLARESGPVILAVSRSSICPPLVRTSYYDAGRWIKLFLGYASIRDRFLLQMARDIDSFSTQRSLPLDELVRNPDYLDQITRTAFPKRKDTQQYYETSEKVMLAWFKYQKAAGVIGSELGLEGLPAAFLLQNLALVPTEKEAPSLRVRNLRVSNKTIRQNLRSKIYLEF